LPFVIGAEAKAVVATERPQILHYPFAPKECMLNGVTETIEFAGFGIPDYISRVRYPNRNAIVAAQCAEIGKAVRGLSYSAVLRCEAQEDG
jgi:hypothetical protein